jgi:hypothetical protein
MLQINEEIKFREYRGAGVKGSELEFLTNQWGLGTQ